MACSAVVDEIVVAVNGRVETFPFLVNRGDVVEVAIECVPRFAVEYGESALVCGVGEVMARTGSQRTRDSRLR